ncbi:MAG: TolC family protein [Magnetococcales bacterium]|nr:TolC family protein [Magnetococcales bacterium]
MKHTIKFSWVVPSLLPLLLGNAVPGLAAEKGNLQEEIYKTMTPTPEEKIGPWGIVDAIKLSLENDNNVEVIMAKGMREVAGGEYQEKKGAFNPTLGFTLENNHSITPVPSWIEQDYMNLKIQEAALPGGSAPALVKAMNAQASRAELGNGTFTANDLKNLMDVKEMASGLRALNAASIEPELNKTSASLSVKQFFRPGIFAKIEAILDRTDPVNYYDSGARGTGATNIGITQVSIRVPLLRNSGPDAYQWTVDEKEKKLGYESKQEDYRHAVSKRVQTVANAYWDYKEAMEKQDILRVSEKLVKKWAESAKAVAPGGKTKANKDAINTLTARLASESLAVEEGKTAVYTAKNQLAEAMGISVDELTAKGYPADDFPTLSANVEDEALIKRLIGLSQSERSDLMAAKLTETQSNVLLTKAKNDLLPNLVVDATAGIMGGNVDGSTMKHSVKAFGDNVVAPNWKVGMAFDYPFGNDAAEGMVTQRNMAVMRDSMLLEEKSRTVKMGVKKSLNALKNAVPSVELSKQSIKNYWPSVEGSLEKFNQQKDNASLTTVMDLLALEEKLKDALTKHIAAKSALAKSLVDVRFTTGTLLPKSEGDNFVVKKEAILTLP